MSGHLNPGGQQFRGDRGAADPLVTATLAAYQAGQASEQAALTALAATRLLVPVVALLTAGDDKPSGGTASGGTASGGTASGGTASGDKDSEMALPTLIGRDGRAAVIAFTGLDTLARWRPDARPVPAEADRVWRAAVAEGCAVVIDVAGPVPLAVEGARLAALAAGQPVPPLHEDPDVHAEVRAAIAAEPAIAGYSLAPGREDPGREAPGREDPGREAPGREDPGREDQGEDPGREDPGREHATDLAVTLHLARPVRVSARKRALETGPAVNRAAAGLATRLATRLRRGIEVIVAE